MKVSDLKNRVTFYKLKASDGPMPGEEEPEEVYSCWAKVDEMWLKDMELAKQQGTLTDITIIIRDPRDDYVPTNKDVFSIDDPFYKNNEYEIKHVQPDVQDRSYINIVAELHS